KGVDPRSDLWSVAVMFYEMLTCRQPFFAENEFARLTAVLTEPMLPIEQVAPHLSAWTPFFHRGLATSVAERLQTAEEMANAVSAMAHSASAAPVSMGIPPSHHGIAGLPPASAATPQHMPTLGSPGRDGSVPQPHTHASAQKPPG